MVLCVYRDADCMAAEGNGIPSVQDSTAGRKGIYLCTICEHSIQPPSSELRNARVRVSRARVRALYYYIIIIF